MMQTQTVEQRLRLFLLGLAAFLCLGTIVELTFQQHYQEPLQLVPLIFCAIGFVVIAAVLVSPSHTTITVMRVIMGLGTIASLVGVYEHLEQNMGFVMDIKPNTPLFDALIESLKGAAPLLAPGLLAIIGMIALAGTYYHPALGKRAIR